MSIYRSHWDLGTRVARSGGLDEKIDDGRYEEPRVNSFDELRQ